MKHQPRILVVDDSTAMRNAIVRTLRPLTPNFMQAENGQIGFETARQNPFDLIITDVDMPVMDGFTLCKELKSDAKINGIPVIILSSHDKESDIEYGFEIGASAYVSKTNAQQQLPQVVENLLEKASLLKKRLILVVDDSKLIISIVEKGLRNEGFDVLSAPNGKEALEILSRTTPDLIISDLNMPIMDGLTFCRTLRQNSNFSGIPFVCMSSESDRFRMRQMLQSGAATYIVKPFNVDQLIIMVEKLLSDHFQLILKERERLETERQAMLASISSLVKALEARDQYTRGHSEDVSRICIELAKRMNVAPDELEEIAIAARLHDIGKIGVRDDVLLKPGKLTDVEFAMIKRHPVVGAKILEPIPSLGKAISIVLSHHERFDGKGYPEGLKGKNIPFWARVTAVADTYHALTSNRPYRSSLPREKALQIIADVRGTQLCPESVDLFLGWIQAKMYEDDPGQDNS
jgi:response regulator RpfG family c-di-GMP phosphodiesterase